MDVKLFDTENEGNIEVINGIVTMTSEPDTAVYLSLFGGNEDDPGLSDTTKSWWGNIGESDTAYQYRSKTQNLLRALPATTNNLKRLKDAVLSDLSWMTDKKIDVSVSIPEVNKIKIEIFINGVATVKFIEDWKGVL